MDFDGINTRFANDFGVTQVAEAGFGTYDHLKRVGKDCHAALLVDGGDCIFECHAFGDGACDPQREDMAFGAGDFHAGDDVEGIVVAVFVCPQAGVHRVVVGDGDDIERSHAGDVVKDFFDGVKAIAGGGVHVNVGETHCDVPSLNCAGSDNRKNRQVAYLRPIIRLLGVMSSC